MNLKFDITPKEYKIVLDILYKYLKTPTKIWIFGSRAKHKTKRNSDLDIAIESTEAIPVGVLADLKEAFTDAPLPYTVDIVELNRVKPEFQNIINQHKVLLTIIGNIPKLRFPEFRDAGEWVEKTLENIVDSENSSLTLNKIDLKKKGYSVYGADGVVGYIDEYQQDERYISIIKDGAGIGRLKLCQPKSSVLGTLTCLKSKNLKNFNLDWIYYQMNIIDFTLYKKGSGIPHIYFSDFKAKSIGVPQPQEQQKIAACLTALDDLISAATGRLGALKQHKKGLMQQLFPTQGETMPKLRFPEFRDAGEWEVQKISQNLSESRVKGSKGDVAKKLTVKLWGNGVFEKQEALKGSTNTQYYRRKAGQFIYSKLDFLNQAFGIVPDHLDNYESTVDLPCFDVSHELNACFLLEYVKRKDFYKKYGEIADGGRKAKRIQVETFLDFPIFLPSFVEQQKIAACLTALDDLIVAQTQKIAKLKTHKRGLMQGLFPKIEN